VLDERLAVSVPLDDHGLGLVVVEVDVAPLGLSDREMLHIHG